MRREKEWNTKKTRPGRTAKLAQYGILTAFALIVSYVEAQVPAFFAVPGMKLGLTNVIVLIALYLDGWQSALVINIMRILLVSILFSNGMSFVYSLSGGLFSTMVMILLKRTGKFHMISVSVAGGIAHNVGQILVAMIMLQTSSLAWYLFVLWIAGLVSGALIGVLGAGILKRLKNSNRDGML